MQDKLFQCLRCFNEHTGGVRTIAISPDGQTLVSGSWDNTIKIWHLTTGQRMRTLERHVAPLTCVTLSPDGQILVSSSWDKTVKIWDFHTGEVKHSWQIYESEEFCIIDCLVISPDGKTLYTGTRYGSTYYWDINTAEELGNLGIASSGSSLLAMSADGRTLVGTYTGSLRVYDLPQHTWRFRVETDHDSPSLAISPDGETIFIGDYNSYIHLWDAHNGQELSAFRGGTFRIR